MNLKFLLFSIGLWSFVESQSPSFDQWKKDNPVAYNKAAQYKSASQIQSTYAANVKKIQAHNANTKTPYKMKANAKAAYTEQERMKFKGYKVKAIANKTQADASIMKNKFTSATSRPTSTTRKLPTTPSRRTTTPAKRGRRDVSNNENEHLRVARAPIPDNLDYTPDLQPVKDQQNCGASWAFAANTVIEYHAKKNGTDIILSEQNLIDCDAKSSGCSGGNPFDAYLYAIGAGLASNNLYGYSALDQTCKTEKFPPQLYLNHACYHDLNGNENNLKINLARFGPVTTGISTLGTGFDFYTSGVFEDAACSSDRTKADMAVTVVGYGSDNGVDYWLIRNSWGTAWGEGGYMKLARNKNNHCGIANYVSFPCPW